MLADKFCIDNRKQQKKGKDSPSRRDQKDSLPEKLLPDQLEHLRNVFLSILMVQITATQADLRTVLKIPDDFDPHFFDSILKPLVQAGIIQPEEDLNPCRARSRSGSLKSWRLIHLEKAEAWLRLHSNN